MPETVTRKKPARNVIKLPAERRDRFELGVYIEPQPDEMWRVYGHGWYDPPAIGGERKLRRVRLEDYALLPDALRDFPAGKVLSKAGGTVLGVVLPD
jgi:hypothetical protein